MQLKRTAATKALTIGLAMSSMYSVAALSTPVSAATTTVTVDTLASQIVSLGTKAHDGGALAKVVAPVLTLMSQPSFDWNEVMFGTDTRTVPQQKTATDLSPDIQQLATFSAMTQTAAIALINDVVTKMQVLNPAIQSADVLNFIENIEQQSPTEMLNLLSLQSGSTTLTPAVLATSVHTFFSTNLSSAPASIQDIFSAVGVGSQTTSGGGGGAGSTSGSTSGGTTGGSGTTGGTSSLGDTLRQIIVGSTGMTLNSATGGSTVQLVVPPNAFDQPEQVSITTGSIHRLPLSGPLSY